MKLIDLFLKEHNPAEITKQEGNFSPLIMSTILSGGFKPYINKFYPFDFGSFLMLSNDKQGIVFFDKKIYQECTRNTLQRYLKNKFIEEDYYKIVRSEINKIYFDNSPKKLKFKNLQKIQELSKEIINLSSHLLACTVFSESLDLELIKEFLNNLDCPLKIKTEFLTTCQLTYFESFANKKDQILVKSNLDSYSIQYLFCDYCVATHIDQVLNKVEEHIQSKNGLLRLKKKLQRNRKELNENRKKVLEFKNKLDGNLLKLFNFIEESRIIRDNRKESIQKISTVLSNAVFELLSRKKISLNLAPFVLLREDINSNLYEQNDYVPILEQRKLGYCVYYNKKGIQTQNISFELDSKKVFEEMDNIIH